MEMLDIYRNIAERTKGDIYIGVVGPVRTGKSTFIKRFMDLMVLPNIEDEFQKERARDELPQSASGKTIMTTEPKFVPEDAVNIALDDKMSCRVRLVDCVGYLVDSALGLYEDEVPRMVSTPWSDEQIPFEQAAEAGTHKVISEHSTIGIVVTTDGTVTEIPKEDYAQAEDRVIQELKSIQKPFIIVLNSAVPNAPETRQVKEDLEARHGVPVAIMNCKKMDESDIGEILNTILKEFPIADMVFKVPGWVKALGKDHWVMNSILTAIAAAVGEVSKLSDVKAVINNLSEIENIKKVHLDQSDVGTGESKLVIETVDGLFYKVIGEETGIDLKDDRNLIEVLKELVQTSNEFAKFEEAMNEVRDTGYGIVTPQFDELSLEPPEIIKHGNRFGVKLKASAPSIHMIRCDVETEIAPLVGTEKQSQELVNYLISEFDDEPDRIWESDIFGKSLNELVTEGLNNKVYKMPEDSQKKLRETLERMINEGNGGLICIIV